MDGFRWFPVVSGSFWVVSGGFSYFQVVLAPFRSFLVLVSKYDNRKRKSDHKNLSKLQQLNNETL